MMCNNWFGASQKKNECINAEVLINSGYIDDSSSNEIRAKFGNKISYCTTPLYHTMQCCFTFEFASKTAIIE